MPSSNVYLSHDLEDIITVVDGCTELPEELAHADHAPLRHVAGQTRELLAHPELPNALPGIVAQPIRAGIVLERLQRIALLDSTP